MFFSMPPITSIDTCWFSDGRPTGLLRSAAVHQRSLPATLVLAIPTRSWGTRRATVRTPTPANLVASLIEVWANGQTTLLSSDGPHNDYYIRQAAAALGKMVQ